jgi:DNA-binding NtrC family response regulator
VRVAVVRALASRGYRTLAARTATEALAIVSATAAPVDLVLSDLILPGARGTDAVEQVRRLAPKSRALYMSGYTDHVALRGGLLDDPRGFIQKPFALDALAHKVREVLDADYPADTAAAGA